MNKLDKDYLALCQDILDNGIKKNDRTGTGTISVFGRQIRHKMSDGFPLLTTKKMSLKNIATELRWFLNGDTNIKFLVDRGCNIWNGDAYKNYLKAPVPHKDKPIHPTTFETITLSEKEFTDKIKNDDVFAKKWGELGPIYGKQWIKWNRYGYHGAQNGALDCGLITQEELDVKSTINQIKILIDDLKYNPDSRRLMVNAWNVSELNDMVLPPCHYGFQLYTRKLTDDELNEISPELKEIRQIKFECVKNQEYFKAANLRSEEQKYLTKLPTRKISLMWNQRSVDTALGLPYNIASYALLLTMIANEVNMIPDELIGNLGDTHLYSNHLDGIHEQMWVEASKEKFSDYEKKVIDEIGNDEELANELKNTKLMVNRIPFDLPTLEFTGGIDSPLDGTDYKLINYQSHPAIKFPLSN